MDSLQGRFGAVHLTTLLVVGCLVGLVTISCGSNSTDPGTTEPDEAGVTSPAVDSGATPDVVNPPVDSGPFLDAGPCIPQPIDCTGKCGPVRDACSGEVQLCGACATGQVCDLQLHTCGTPKTKCEDFGAQCGQVKTSCGLYISCGACPVGQECNPDSNQCQPAEAVTCQDLGYECGAAWLGSGDPSVKTNCGTCKDASKPRCNTAFNICEPACGSTTDAGVAWSGPPWKEPGLSGPQQVAAKKAFCDAARQSQGVECGIISDGCGGTIDCSLSVGFSCPAGQGCGVRGVANRCEPFPTPPECEAAGKNCGTLVSACDGKSVTCGVCTGTGEVCNDNGVCGPPCQPSTCATALPQGEECGSPSDGCKGTLNCGCPSGGKCTAQHTCCAPKTCAQLLTAGQCGKQLDDGCGGKVDCNCSAGGTRCVDASKASVTNGEIGSCCVKKTCAANYPGQCGTGLDDGCGGTIDCNCAGGGKSCIVGAAPGQLATPGQAGSCCAETNCAAGACNTSVSSVCVTGKTITCNNCPGGQVCNNMTCCAPTGCNGQCGVTIDPGCGQPSVACGCDLPYQCNGGACTCDAYTCSSPQYNGKCGSFDNGCNGVVNCGCTSGQVCNNNTQACCTPKTCADYAGKCGNFDNGCGGTISCNPCGGGQVCNNSTQSCCSPKTCAANYAGKCGNFDNACGGQVNCGCASGQTCNNTTQSCCTPLTCNSSQYAGKCGTFDNACGGQLNCGCNGFNTCGGGGTPGICGCTPKKAPQDCAGQVGTFADGCGGQFTCTG